MLIRPRLCTCLSLVLSLTSHSVAAQDATLSLAPASVDSLLHYYDGELIGGLDEQFFTFWTPTVQLVDYNTIQVSVQAPGNEEWHIAYDGQGFSSAALTFDLYYNGSFGGPLTSISSSSLDFDFVTGGTASLGAFSDSSHVADSGDTFCLNMSYGVQGNFSFSGFTATITFDNSNLAATSLNSFANSFLAYQYQPTDLSASDPGPQMLLHAPEPSGLAFIGLGLSGLGMLALRRRRS